MLNYNDANSVGQKWSVARDTVGDANLTFSVTDTGQVQFSLTAISGTGHTGVINYTSQTIQQQY